MKRVGIVSVAILATACGQLNWTHPSGPADFDRDALACDQAGVHASGGGVDMMAALNLQCMKAHGWELEQTGSL